MVSTKIKTRLATVVLALAALSAVVTATVSSDTDAGDHCAYAYPYPDQYKSKEACCDGYCSALHDPQGAPEHYKSCYNGCVAHPDTATESSLL